MIKKTAKYCISSILIWIPFPFMILLDIATELFHQICFPIYRIPKVRRSDYIEIRDRARLQYLNPIEKIGCAYCGYANGLIAYIKEIGNRTEDYQCAISHKRHIKGTEYQKENNFAPYGDKEAYKKKRKESRMPKK